MPWYEYHCPDCGAGFEQRRTVAERNDPRPCPACGSGQTVLRLSVPAMVGARSEPAPGICPGSGRPCGCANTRPH